MKYLLTSTDQWLTGRGVTAASVLTQTHGFPGHVPLLLASRSQSPIAKKVNIYIDTKTQLWLREEASTSSLTQTVGFFPSSLPPDSTATLPSPVRRHPNTTQLAIFSWTCTKSDHLGLVCCGSYHRVAKSRTQPSNWTTLELCPLSRMLALKFIGSENLIKGIETLLSGKMQIFLYTQKIYPPHFLKAHWWMPSGSWTQLIMLTCREAKQWRTMSNSTASRQTSLASLSAPRLYLYDLG